MQQALLRQLPKIDRFLEDSRILDRIAEYGKVRVLNEVRSVLEHARTSILDGLTTDISFENLIEQIDESLKVKQLWHLRRVVNGTGVVIHTNFGRSLLPSSVVAHIASSAAHYTNLEYNLETGARGSRYSHVVDLLKQLTGAEAALVVNNNAAAVLLTLSALAKDKKVIVSRGELVEIGGGFRIPDVMHQSGAILVEVGTTNKTRRSDYEGAIDSDTALLMKVHTSNFKIMGFTESVSISELAKIKNSSGRDLLLIDDLGSGSLLDLSPYGLLEEPTVLDSLKAGSDLVLFSGDKLLGGPQCGIILGSKDAVSRLSQHPLNRALRIDKLSLAALEATLKLYEDPAEALREIPTLSMLTKDFQSLLADGNALIKRLNEADELVDRYHFTLQETSSEVGGGAMPLAALKSVALAIEPRHMSVNQLSDRLRKVEIPVIGRIQNDLLHLDLRTLCIEDFAIIEKALSEVEV